MYDSIKIYSLYCFFSSIFQVMLLDITRYRWPWITMYDYIETYVLVWIFHFFLLILIVLLYEFVPMHKFKIMIILFPLCYIGSFFYFLPDGWVVNKFEIWVDGKPGRNFLFYFSYNIMAQFISIILAVKLLKLAKN